MIVEEQRTNNRQDKEGGVSRKRRRVESGEDGKEDSGIRLSLPVNTKLY